MAQDTTENKQHRGKYIACYALYGVLVVLAAVVIFVVWQQTLLVLIGLIFGTRQVSQSFYMLGLIALTFAAFILLMIAEPYMRRGVPKDVFVSRFIRIALPLLIFGALGLLINWWGLRAMGDLLGA